MFLDDLPSATTMPGSGTEFQENIPLGFLHAASTSIGQEGDGLRELAIYNHLEIKVYVHETIQANPLGSYEQPTIVPIDILGYKIDVHL